jgi:hypothetical protein
MRSLLIVFSPFDLNKLIIGISPPLVGGDYGEG